MKDKFRVDVTRVEDFLRTHNAFGVLGTTAGIRGFRCETSGYRVLQLRGLRFQTSGYQVPGCQNPRTRRGLGQVFHTVTLLNTDSNLTNTRQPAKMASSQKATAEDRRKKDGGCSSGWECPEFR